MNGMKKLLSTICALGLLVAAALSFSACGGEAVVNYKLSEDGTHYIVSGVSGNVRALKSYEAPAEYAEEEGGVALPVTEIGDEAFMKCTSLYNVTLHEGVERIGVRAFMQCGFRTFTIPESVKSIGYGAFGMCTTLTEIVIPEAVTEIEPYAFAYCSNLESVEIKGAVTEIEAYVFANSYASVSGSMYLSTALKKVTIPASVEKIHIKAFDGNLIEDFYFGGSERQWDELYFYETVKQEGKDGKEDEYVEKKVEKDKVISSSVKIHFAEQA